MQYAWQVWPCLGKTSTVSGYLCCTPGSGSASRLGDVQRQLAGRVRVQPHPDLVRGRRDLGVGRAARPAGPRAGDVRLGQHVRLREDQAVDRVVGGRVPVDELIDHVGVGPEGQHGGHRPDGQPFAGAEPGPLVGPSRCFAV